MESFSEILLESEKIPLLAKQLIDIPNNGGVRTVALLYDSIKSTKQLSTIFKTHDAIIFLLLVRLGTITPVGHFVALRKFGDTYYWFDPYGLGLSDVTIAHESTLVSDWVRSQKHSINSFQYQAKVHHINTCLRHCAVFLYFSQGVTPRQYHIIITSSKGTPDEFVTALTIVCTKGIKAKKVISRKPITLPSR